MTLSAASFLVLSLIACGVSLRPPSVPLIVNSPYMSIWSNTNNLYDSWPTLWSGTIKGFYGMVSIDNDVYRYMGSWQSNGRPTPLQQLGVTVNATNTVYVFGDNRVNLQVQFTTPSMTDIDLDVISRPVTYITYSAFSIDGRSHRVQIYLDTAGEIAVNTVDQQIVWGTHRAAGLTALRIGTAQQPVLERKGDNVGIDWGYFYFATPENPNAKFSLNSADNARNSFLGQRPLPPVDTDRMPRACNNDWPVLALAFDLGQVSSTPVSRHVIAFYDDEYSIKWFGDYLRPYWRRNPNVTAETLLVQAEADYPKLMQLSSAFDAKLWNKLRIGQNDNYATLAVWAYRQVMGGIMPVFNDELQTTWIFMKEISSNGDLSTVDVIFPASTFFLYLNPDILKLLLMPIFSYANNETSVPYNSEWAPHHLGTYPVAYILTQEQEDMPVEESANLLVIIAALCKEYNSVSWVFPKYARLVEQWGQYLAKTLPDPGDQLCTDDFMGPSPHNANLALKGIIGLAAISEIYKVAGDSARANYYQRISANYSAAWMQLADDGDHYKLQYDRPNSWSLKYNLLWQDILGIDVFPDSVVEKELKYYVNTKLNKFGVPLDVRATFTKLDWELWVAAVALQRGHNDIFQKIVDSVAAFADQTTSRVPMTDWYQTTDARQSGFQARPVVGAIYAPSLLLDGSYFR